MESFDYRYPKLNEYFRLIERDILDPVEKHHFGGSCFATMLLMFACMDGLGRLIHPKSNATAAERFKLFASTLGTMYGERGDELWHLRNSLAHNGLNSAAFLTQIPVSGEFHLRQSSSTNSILIDTRRMFTDFKHAVCALRRRLNTEENLANQIEARLEWCSVEYAEFCHYLTTAPPPIRFVRTTVK